MMLKMFIPILAAILVFEAASPSGMGERTFDSPVQIQPRTFITAPVSVKLNRIPDQADIIFLGNGYIYAMDHRGGNVTQITCERPRQYEHVAVSFDRRFIVANEQLPNPTNQPGGKSVILLYDLERGTEEQLVPDFKTAGNGGVDWDANGSIYFAAQEKDVVANPQTPEDHIKNAVANDVYKIRRDGTGLLRLTQTTDGGEADVGVSPDGSLVSYIREVINFPGENHTEVWVINPDGSHPRMIYKGGLVRKASVHDPEISPDNKQVAFSKVNPDFKNFPDNPAANTAHDLYVINLDGTGLRRVTRPGPISIIPNWKDSLILYTEINEAAQYAGISIVSDQGSDQMPGRIRSGPFAPNWIPQASAGNLEGFIVYVALDATGRLQVFSSDPQGGQRRQLTNSEGDKGYPAWSHDGQRVAFAWNRAGQFEIWVMDADGGNEKQLTRLPAGADEMTRARWQNFVPSWSPDNSLIAFSSARSGQTEIWMMNADGSNQRQLTTTPVSYGSNAPCWSPDGNKILFASNRSGTFQTYVMDANGGNVLQLTQSLPPDFPDANVPVWSPDGRKIAFWSGLENRHGEIWVMDADGGNRLQLTDGPGQSNSDNPAWSPDGRHIIFETNRSGVRVETWIMNADGTNQRLLLPFGVGAGRLPWQLANPLENRDYFVNQHYRDFLDRDADGAGLSYWSGQLAECGTDGDCIRKRRVGVSAAFFVELEFQRTGSFVYRLFKGGLARRPSFQEFNTDRAQLREGATLEADKQILALAFVQRNEFVQKYVGQTTATAFVTALITSIQQASNVNLESQRDVLTSKYNAGGADMNQSRALALRDAIDSTPFVNSEYNAAFVLMQYFGYLRRDPDQGGYTFWLEIVNNPSVANYRSMVCAFLTSREYQLRFSSHVPRSDSECADIN